MGMDCLLATLHRALMSWHLAGGLRLYGLLSIASCLFWIPGYLFTFDSEWRWICYDWTM